MRKTFAEALDDLQASYAGETRLFEISVALKRAAEGNFYLKPPNMAQEQWIAFKDKAIAEERELQGGAQK